MKDVRAIIHPEISHPDRSPTSNGSVNFLEGEGDGRLPVFRGFDVSEENPAIAHTLFSQCCDWKRFQAAVRSLGGVIADPNHEHTVFHTTKGDFGGILRCIRA